MTAQNCMNVVRFKLKTDCVDKYFEVVDNYKIKVNLFASSPSSAINVFKNKYPNAEDIYVIQDLFKGK